MAFKVEVPVEAAAVSTTQNVITELEFAIAHASAQRCAEMLSQITDLFLHQVAKLSEDKIELFDDVMTRLALQTGASVRSLLASRLAPVPDAPFNIIRLLASNDEIEVAYPILAHAECIDEFGLALIARTKGQEHLLAISSRRSVNGAIADLLVERGNKQVLLSVANNPGVELSEAGFTLLVKRSEVDDVLATSLGLRRDIPYHIFKKLLATASDLVRTQFKIDNLNVRREFSAAEPHFLFTGDGPILADCAA
jgi:uncharacterized protein (DUF2336 family)